MEDLGRAFQRAVRVHDVPGAQLAVLRDGRVWEFVFGEERHASGRAMGRDTKVPIGSITKAFTATLLMVLVSDGDVDLDEPVAEYLPEVRQTGGGLAEVLTTRHLLSHTGGLCSEVVAPSADARPPLAASLLELLHAPGEGFSYSNAGYALAGRLVEVATGMTWSEAVRTILLKPLGIAPAFIVGAGAAASSIAHGHTVNRVLRRVRPVEQELSPIEAPAGGLAASAADLVELSRMHLRSEHGGTDHGLVAPADLVEMRRPVPGAEPFGLADGWGLGLALFRSGDTEWFGHDGTADGTSCHLRLDPESGTVVALTANSATGAALWRQLLPDLRTAGLDVGEHATSVDLGRRVPIPPGCAGDYVNGGTAYSVVVQDGELRLVVDGDTAARLTSHDGLVFSVTDPASGETGHPGRFLRDPRSGVIDRIQVGGRIASRRQRAREVA
ncbi:serine hydrolase domain-containing protein [Saccharothrix sp. ALI-22-I]|uniref:serine hydrolase domain-containing protein n=1 Tax=Saccharothrix sp. ALI-22-I TaxID=1933778 RepID=UPI000A078947|nr:serine hydrolase domain-containing protein [Saccharothrix sp. ALI-22-I]